MFTLQFNKTFITGNLAGITIQQKICFPTQELMDEYQEWLNTSSLATPHSDTLTRAKWFATFI